MSFIFYLQNIFGVERGYDSLAGLGFKFGSRIAGNLTSLTGNLGVCEQGSRLT